jgi:uncharacterized protein
MSAVTAPLSSSSFIAELTPREKSPVRFVLAVVLGVLAYLFAAFIGVFVSFGLLIAMAGWPAPTSVENLRALLQRFTTLAASDGRSFGDALQILAVAIPDNLLPIYAVIGVVLLLQAPRLKRLLTSAPRFRWQLLLSGLAFYAVLIGPVVWIGQALDPHAVGAPVLTVSKDPVLQVVYLLVCVAAFLPAAFGEEILFRGWVLRETSAVTRNVAALLVINGVVFAAAHLDFAPDAFLERAILGAGFAYMTLRLGGVEFSTGAHFGNNILLVLFADPLTLKPPPPGGLTLDALTQDAFLLVSMVLMTELTARWSPLRRWAGVDQAGSPSAATTVVAEHFS